MFDLPTDIAVTVLDYITAVNDLKALCLTSKACHERVIPRLYRHVNIPLWHHSVLTFSRQFHSGESYAPEDKDKPDSSTVKQEEDMRMVTLMEVLQLFPRDVLRDFR
ncbi:hypothetical protein BU24DRAFT_82052 [Aaosphaeria arxii CBS 175.79]|uniref:F-box domain-containing protein n=1 Tax=Aaosphaeria arxii CBS 175.79 TaxID=1450172 RepID=A0A6A5XA34_9PLEO|nr:uncharacterized protein BU24DRAFT_82052 [Aaosphaeria arxii CBS 175.79]KAF2009780.1 hypothetical protein BU24DRAFT_82052 [Aaosphaeria arxii CBS 175.79]